MALTSTAAEARTEAGGERPPARGRGRYPRWLPYAFLVPAIVFELLVHVVPMLAGVYMSLLQLNVFFLRRWLEAPFTGLQNYRYAIDVHGGIGIGLLRSCGITIAFTVAVVGLSWLLAIFGATMLQRSFPGRGLLRTVFLVPYAVPLYAGSIVWKFILQRDDGMLNHLLTQLHLSDGKTFWLLGNNAFLSIVLVQVWRLWPFALLTLMAGMQSITDELYEAAAVDGASMWQQFRRITLPMLRPVNQVLVLVLFLWTFNDFNVPYTLFANSVPPSADIITIHIYQGSFVTWNFGLGSAMSVLLLLFLLVITLVYLVGTTWRTRHESPGHA
jgi:multiple sugar transport system permease protein